MIANQRGVEFRGVHGGIGTQGHVDDHREAILAQGQRGEVGRKTLRQHREHLGNRVNGGGIGAGMVLDRRSLAHQGVDVGYRHEDPDRSARIPLCDRQLIEVAGIVIVDGGPRELPQVAKSACRGGGCRPQVSGLKGGLGGELRQQSARAHGLTRDSPQPVQTALVHQASGERCAIGAW